MTQPCTVARYVYTCQLTKSDGTRMLAVWHTGMFCEGGLCSHVSYAVPSGFNSYLDLANLRRTVKGRFVWIGAKPILLLASTRTNGAKTQHSFNAQRESRNATRDSQVPLPSKALSLR